MNVRDKLEFDKEMKTIERISPRPPPVAARPVESTEELRPVDDILTDAWHLYDSGTFSDCREMLAQWARPGQAPKGASPSQAAEGFNLRACCLCRLAAEETEQTKFAGMITEAIALFRYAAGCSERGKTEGEVALKEAIGNRYDGRLREARTRYDAGALDEALAALEPWTHPDPLPVGATEDQNARGFHLRALCLCRKAALGGDDATCEGMINDARTLFPYGHALQVEQRAEGQAMLRAALVALGKARFARQLYGEAYLNLKEANDLQESIELRFLLAECRRLDPASHTALNGPELLRSSIHDYQQVIKSDPDSSQGRQSVQRLPEVVRRCNQTALMKLEPGAWGDRGEFFEGLLHRHRETWWQPEKATAARGGPGFLFDGVIEATTVKDALAIARERGDMWLLRVISPVLRKDQAGVIIRAAFTVEVYDVLEGRRVKSKGFLYKGDQVGKTGTAGCFADQLLADLRSQLLTDVIERVPELLGTRVPVAQ